MGGVVCEAGMRCWSSLASSKSLGVYSEVEAPTAVVDVPFSINGVLMVDRLRDSLCDGKAKRYLGSADRLLMPV
jgi:hypothetical protein